MRFSDLAGKNVVVWGYGLEGRAALAHCRTLGIDIRAAVPDTPSAKPTDPDFLLVGDAAAQALRTADVVIKSPGVPVTSPLYVELAKAGARFTSVLDLWLTDNAHRTVGVTGTKGKSTTATAIGHLLEAVGESVSVRGNIGRNLLDADGTETVVVEISSYQAQSLTVSPRVAVVTSLFPEHLPWHGSAERYFADKLKVVDYCPEHIVLPGDDPRLVAMVRDRIDSQSRLHLTGPDTPHVDSNGGISWPGVGRVDVAELPVMGAHNAANLALALLVVGNTLSARSGSAAQALLRAVTSFRPLEHRLEQIPSHDGRVWVDDMLATAPEATVAALKAWPDEEIALIFGGADRGLSFEPLSTYLIERRTPVHVLLIGPAGARFGDEHAAQLPHLHRLHRFRGLEDAVFWGMSQQNPARLVLMSPGAPSFDEYADYSSRATHFRELVDSAVGPRRL